MNKIEQEIVIKMEPEIHQEEEHLAQCSAIVIRPSINSAELQFSPKSVLSHIFVLDLVNYNKKICQT